jgi:hypothetical protein
MLMRVCLSTLGGKISPAFDTSSITGGDFRVLPPALADWAATVIKDSRRSVVVTVQ